MNERQLLEVKERFPGSSWAIWSEQFRDEGCVEESPEALVEYIVENRHRLNPGVVFVSLNPASSEPEAFSNFHSPLGKHYDERLKQFIQDNELENLIGGYMTDIVPDVIDPDSENVEADDADVAGFLQRLAFFDRPEHHVICFTGKTFEALKRYFSASSSSGRHNIESFTTETEDTVLHVHRVWFFGLYGVYQDKVVELEQQLQYLNDEIV